MHSNNDRVSSAEQPDFTDLSYAETPSNNERVSSAGQTDFADLSHTAKCLQFIAAQYNRDHFDALVVLFTEDLRQCSYSVVNQFRLRAADRPDIEIAATMGLVSAIKSFDPTRGVAPDVYARILMYRDARREAQTLRRQTVNETQFLQLPDSSEEVDVVDPDAPDPEQITISRLTNEVDEAIRKLSPDHRRVLLLYYYQGRSVQEVAKEVRIPVGTVKSRLSHARRRFEQVYRAILERSAPSP